MGFFGTLANLRSVRGGASVASTISVDVDSTAFKATVAKASDDLRRLDNYVDRTAVKARRARADATAAAARPSLLQRMRTAGFGASAEGLQFGALKLGGAGLQIEGGAMVGASGALLAASLTTRMAAGATNQAVMIRDAMRTGEIQNFSEAAETVARNTARGVVEQLHNFFPVGTIAKNITTLVSGKSAEEIEAVSARMWEKFWATDAEIRRKAEEREKALNARFREINQRYDREYSAMLAASPSTFKLGGAWEKHALAADRDEANRDIRYMKALQDRIGAIRDVHSAEGN